MRSPFPRRIRNLPAKLLLLLIVVILFLSIPQNHHRPTPHLDSTSLTDSQQSLRALYDKIRLDEISRKRFNSTGEGAKLGSPGYIGYNGEYRNLDTDIGRYTQRLKEFSSTYLSGGSSSFKEGVRDSVESLESRVPPTPNLFPKKIWSTDKYLTSSTEGIFNLWQTLLSMPLSPSLLKPLKSLLSDEVEVNGKWEVEVVDDQGIEKLISQWVGEDLNDGSASGPWGKIWKDIQFGVLKADLFRYFAMLVHGGIYADSDTAVS